MKTILVNGYRVEIRTNLFDFLEVFKLRNDVHDTWIWIDQLSINQNDIPERNSQVAQMDKVYRSAKETIAWLGSNDDHDGLGFATIRRIDSALIHSGDVSAEHREILIRELAACSELELEAMKPVLCNDYWQRHWIAQEILLAQQVHVHYGTLSLPWRIIAHLLFTTADAFDGLPPAFAGTYAVFTLGTIKQKSIDREYILHPWIFLVTYGAFSLCHDPRDKVYGLQSILPLNCRVEVDYNKPVLEDFLDTSITLALLITGTTRVEYYSWMFMSPLAIGMGLVVSEGLDVSVQTTASRGANGSASQLERELREVMSEHVSESQPHDPGLVVALAPPTATPPDESRGCVSTTHCTERGTT
jgi:hypothetical protein